MKKLAFIVALMIITQPVFAMGCVTSLKVKNGTINISGTSDETGYVTAKLESGDSLIYFTQTGISNNEFSVDITDINIPDGEYDLTVTGKDFIYKKGISYPDGGDYIFEKDKPSEEEASVDIRDSVMVINRVKVSGTVIGEDNTVTLILYKGYDAEALNDANIGYIEQKQSNQDGSFEFEFTFRGNIKEYNALVYSRGAKGEAEIVKSDTVYSYISAETEIISESDCVTLNAHIANESMNDAEYILILMFYDESGSLISVDANTKKTVNADEKIKTDSFTAACPQGAAKVYATVWSSFDTIVPYTEGTEKDI